MNKVIEKWCTIITLKQDWFWTYVQIYLFFIYYFLNWFDEDIIFISHLFKLKIKQNKIQHAVWINCQQSLLGSTIAKKLNRHQTNMSFAFKSLTLLLFSFNSKDNFCLFEFCNLKFKFMCFFSVNSRIWEMKFSKCYLNSFLLIVIFFFILQSAVTGGDLNPYKVLGISRNADEKTIRNAYRKLAKEW
jgi:hypothetical protein